jgi:protein-L-isoaspartate(D-aspartate) O-methyltransferase
MKHFKKAHRNMIFGQFLPNKLTDPNVLHAFEMVWREDFIPESVRALSYCDQPVAVTADRQMLSSLSLMRLVHAAQISKKELVLHVGAGAGYGSIVMAYLAKRVVALEEDPVLFASLTKLPEGYDVPNMSPVLGKLEEGAPSQGPFDVIIIEGAIEALPEVLLGQVKDGGRLLSYRPLPSGKGEDLATAFRVRHIGGHYSDTPLFEAVAPSLKSFTPQPTFVL